MRHLHYLEMAADVARSTADTNFAVGAVVCRNGKVLGTSGSSKNRSVYAKQTIAATTHAELGALLNCGRAQRRALARLMSAFGQFTHECAASHQCEKPHYPL